MVQTRIKAIHANNISSQISTVRNISPAAKAGIRANDFLVWIDSMATDTLPTTSIAQKLISARGSICSVVIERRLETRQVIQHKFKLTRGDVYAKPVKGVMLKGKTGCIRISDFFNANTCTSPTSRRTLIHQPR